MVYTSYLSALANDEKRAVGERPTEEEHGRDSTGAREIGSRAYIHVSEQQKHDVSLSEYNSSSACDVVMA